MERIWHERKEVLEGMNFLQYQKKKKVPYAVLFLCIDRFENFRRMTDDRYLTLLEKLAEEGTNEGIYLILTASGVGTGEVPASLFEKMKVTMTLEMSDRFRYGDILRRYQMDVLPGPYKGRGLCRENDRILEFQTPIFSAQEDDYERIRQIEELAEKWNTEPYKEMYPVKFPVIPKKPRRKEMPQNFFKRKKQVAESLWAISLLTA